MKKLLLTAAVLAFAAPAMASKARMQALGLNGSTSSDLIIDQQTVFDNPAHLMYLGDYVTFELGKTSNLTPTAVAGQDPDAEGGAVKTFGNSKYGVYLGRKSDFTSAIRYYLGFKGQENPVELQYATKVDGISYGASLNYSSAEKKSGTAQKEYAYGTRFGAKADKWEGYAVVGLGSKATGSTASNVPIDDYNGDGSYGAGEVKAVAADPNSELKGTTGFKVGGGYHVTDSIYSYLAYYQDGAEYSSSVNTALNGMKIAQSQLEIGAINHMKLDSGLWYYGIAASLYNYSRTNVPSTKDRTTDTMTMPFFVGIETKLNSMITARASVLENVLLGYNKVDDGTGTHAGLAGDLVDDTDTIANNTAVAVGLGMNFGKWQLDGVMAASTTGKINADQFMTNASLTYNF